MGGIKNYDEILNKIYYDVTNPGSYGGFQRLYAQTKKEIPKLKMDDVRKWGASQDTYTLHKPVRRKFPRTKTLAFYPDELWQADLMDVRNISRENNHMNYILTIIDVYSRFAYALPVRDKSGLRVLEAFKTLEKHPRLLQTDQGKEFFNSQVAQWLRDHNIHHYATQNIETKASVVERFNRTLRNRMHRYFQAHQTNRYLDILPDLLHSYNNSVHRMIGTTPLQMRIKKETLTLKDILTKPPIKKVHKFAVGDTVRITKPKDLFLRGYQRQWTNEKFIIQAIKPDGRFVLIDTHNEPLIGSFYHYELQRVT